MTEDARPSRPDAADRITLAEGWRVAGLPPPPGAPAGRRLLYRLRRLLAPLWRPQETFNAAVTRRLDRLSADAVDLAAQATQIAGAAADTAARAEAESARTNEALGAHARRTDAAVAAVEAAQLEVRTALGVLQGATRTLERELASLPAGGGDAAASAAPAPARAEALGSHRYVGFEDRFRGSADEIRARLSDYVPLFAGAADVLDVGCGRGEFLALLKDAGVTARGVDINPSMADACRARGLEAEAGDALAALTALPDGALGGLFSAQVVEHLEPAYLAALLDAAFDKLRPGAPIVLETVNPACWFAFFDSYLRDLSHVRPIHPETLQYLLVASGFQQVEIQYRAPFPESEKLQGLPPGALPGEAAVEAFNGNVERLNKLLFSWMDYAAVGRRP